MKKTFTTTKRMAFLLVAVLVFVLAGCVNTTTETENAVYLCTEKITYYLAPRPPKRVNYKYDKYGCLLVEKYAGMAADGKDIIINYTYDDNGNLLTKKFSDGHYVYYKYDDKGRMISEEHVYFDGEVFFAKYAEWNSDGSHTKISDSSSEYCKSFYDAEGNLTKRIQYYKNGDEKIEETITEYWKNGKIKRTNSVIYNEFEVPIDTCDVSRLVETNGNLTKLYRINEETGEKILEKKYLINAEGLPVTVIKYYDTDRMWTIHEYEYYPSKMIKKIVICDFTDDGKLSFKHCFEYTDDNIKNDTGKAIRGFLEKYDESGKIIYKDAFTRDPNAENRRSEIYDYGNSIGEVTDENGRVIVETYVVDSFGNVVGREKCDKATGEKIMETVASNKFGSIEYVTKSEAENVTERTVIDKNGNVIDTEIGLDFYENKTNDYSRVTMQYKVFYVAE